MSRAAIRAIATSWGCTEEDVMHRLTDMLKASGHVPQDADPQWYQNDSYARKLIIGVTQDHRVALLDENDQVIAWIDTKPS